MSRTKDTPMTPAQAPELLPAVVSDIQAAQGLALSHEQSDTVLAAGIDLGRLEALDFVATVANSAVLPIYENVKKSKAWRFLRNPKSSNGSNFESFEQFCEVKLGKTYGRMQHLLANRNLVGQDAFEQAERLGLRQVDYNAIKALPAPDQELVRRAVEEAQSRDEVLDLLQELAARHGAEKQKLTKRLEDTDGELKASEERRNKLLLEKEQLELQVQKKLVAATDWPEAFKVLHDQAKHADKSIKLLVGALDAVREEALKAEPSGPDEEAAMERARAVLAEELLSIHRRCAEYLEAMGLKFEKTLGGYASEGLWK